MAAFISRRLLLPYTQHPSQVSFTVIYLQYMSLVQVFFFKFKIKTLDIDVSLTAVLYHTLGQNVFKKQTKKRQQFLCWHKCISLISSRRLWVLWSSLVQLRLLSEGNTWARGRRESSSIKQFSYCDPDGGMWFGPRYRKTCSLVRLRGYRQISWILYPKVTRT